MKTMLMILCLGLATTLPMGTVAAPTWSPADDTRYMKQRMGLARVDDDRTGGKPAGPG